jgi:hypothetical protein
LNTIARCLPAKKHRPTRGMSSYLCVLDVDGPKSKLWTTAGQN